jgi:hypothetical protein
MTLQELRKYIKARVKETTLYSNPSKALSDPTVKDTKMRRELEKLKREKPNEPVSLAEKIK